MTREESFDKLRSTVNAIAKGSEEFMKALEEMERKIKSDLDKPTPYGITIEGQINQSLRAFEKTRSRIYQKKQAEIEAALCVKKLGIETVDDLLEAIIDGEIPHMFFDAER